MAFPRDSAFMRQVIADTSRAVRQGPVGQRRAAEVEASTPRRDMVEVPYETLGRWYEALNTIGHFSSSRNPVSAEEIADLRDEVYSYLQG